MKAIVIDTPGSSATLRMADVPVPPLLPGHVRIQVHTTAVNRADVMQVRGAYPPPPGASSILGLECAGVIAELGEGVDPDKHGWRVGDRVMALLTGGGYAEEVVAPIETLMHVPDALNDVEAGGFPETFLTAFLNVFQLGGAKAQDWVLIHGGSGGVGTAAIQLCGIAGVRSIVTCGTTAKAVYCRALGADEVIVASSQPAPASISSSSSSSSPSASPSPSPSTLSPLSIASEGFVQRVQEITGGKGVAAILDCMGGDVLPSNLQCLAQDGTLVLIGLLAGRQATLDLALLLQRRHRIIASTLRNQSAAFKAALIAAFVERFDEALHEGRLRSQIHVVYPLAQAEEAHACMRARKHIGKIILEVKTTSSIAMQEA